MIEILPHGTGVFLPALIVGHELPEGAVSERVRGWANSPEWVITIHHQAGGMAHSIYPTVAGLVMRLDDNVERISGDGRFLIRGFRAMAEDPDRGLLRRDYPVLLKLVETRGDDYSADELQSLHRLLGPYLTLPPIESGREAFVRLTPCDPLLHFAGWKVLSARALPGCRSHYVREACPTAEEGNLGGFAFSTEAVFDAAKAAGLERLGELVGADRPRVFLLWENCD